MTSLVDHNDTQPTDYTFSPHYSVSTNAFPLKQDFPAVPLISWEICLDTQKEHYMFFSRNPNVLKSQEIGV